MKLLFELVVAVLSGGAGGYLLGAKALAKGQAVAQVAAKVASDVKKDV